MAGIWRKVLNSVGMTVKASAETEAVAKSVENDLVKVGIPRGRAVGLVRKALYGVARNPEARKRLRGEKRGRRFGRQGR